MCDAKRKEDSQTKYDNTAQILGFTFLAACVIVLWVLKIRSNSKSVDNDELSFELYVEEGKNYLNEMLPIDSDRFKAYGLHMENTGMSQIEIDTPDSMTLEFFNLRLPSSAVNFEIDAPESITLEHFGLSLPSSAVNFENIHRNVNVEPVVSTGLNDSSSIVSGDICVDEDNLSCSVIPDDKIHVNFALAKSPLTACNQATSSPATNNNHTAMGSDQNYIIEEINRQNLSGSSLSSASYDLDETLGNANTSPSVKTEKSSASEVFQSSNTDNACDFDDFNRISNPPIPPFDYFSLGCSVPNHKYAMTSFPTFENALLRNIPSSEIDPLVSMYTKGPLNFDVASPKMPRIKYIPRIFPTSNSVKSALLRKISTLKNKSDQHSTLSLSLNRLCQQMQEYEFPFSNLNNVPPYKLNKITELAGEWKKNVKMLKNVIDQGNYTDKKLKLLKKIILKLDSNKTDLNQLFNPYLIQHERTSLISKVKYNHKVTQNYFGEIDRLLKGESERRWNKF